MNKNGKSFIRNYNGLRGVKIVGRWKWDMIKNSIDLSEEVYRIFGINKEDETTSSYLFLELIHSQDRELFQKLITKINTNESPFVQTHHISTREGNSKIINIVGIPKLNSKGEVIEFHGFILDMTDLYQSETKHAKFWEESLDAFIIYDSNFCFVDANKALMDNYYPEFAKADIIGKHITEIVPGIEQTDRFKLYKHVLETGEPLTIEEVITNEKFGPRTLYVKAFKYDENIGIIFSDISELKKQKLELEMYKQHLEDLLEIRNNEVLNLAKFPSENPAPVIRVSNKGILYANESAKRQFLLDDENDLPIVIKQQAISVLLNNKSKTIEWQNEAQTYLLSFIPIKSSKYVNIYGMDITKLKNTERMFEKFVSNVIHELRTPISVLQMSLKYFQRKRGQIDSDLENKILGGAFRNVKILDELIEDLISITKLGDSELELKLENFSIHELISELIEFIDPLVKEKKIKIYNNIKNNIELTADKKKIRQVFQILFDNAVKYSYEESEITINAVLNPFNSEKTNELLIEIIDHGIGFNEKDLPHLFERFFRSQKVENIEGMGLGLSIARSIISKHSGKIYATQNSDEGATFSVLFPNFRII